MTYTTHTAIGAFLGARMVHPVIGFFLGMALHFLVDMVPHGDCGMVAKYHHGCRRDKKEWLSFLAFDAVVATGVGIFLLRHDVYQHQGVFLATIIGSVLPDILVGLSEVLPKKVLVAYERFHFFFHDFFVKRIGDLKFRYALLYQAILVAVLVNLMV